MMNTPEELRQVAADQQQAEADAMTRRDELAGNPGEGLTADTSGHTIEPVTPPSGPTSGLHWMGQP